MRCGETAKAYGMADRPMSKAVSGSIARYKCIDVASAMSGLLLVGRWSCGSNGKIVPSELMKSSEAQSSGTADEKEEIGRSMGKAISKFIIAAIDV